MTRLRRLSRWRPTGASSAITSVASTRSGPTHGRLILVSLVCASILGVLATAGGRTRAAPGLESAADIAAPVHESFCLDGTTPSDYDSMFDAAPAGVVGADYQRVTPLPDGRALWTFQDAHVERAPGEGAIVHNIGMVQDGRCFTLLMGGTRERPEPWLYAARTARFELWYWPMDSVVSADGRLYVYLAEMVERGDRYLEHVEPVSTVVAAIDLDTFDVVHEGPAGDHTADLYGWSAATDGDWTYLFAHCFRQFGYDPFVDDIRIHDSECAHEIRVARVSNGDVFDDYEYWSGDTWTDDPVQASPIIETDGRLANPADITVVRGRWLAVIKVDDWFGEEIVVEVASHPTGPFRTNVRIDAEPRCKPQTCNTYFASWISTAGDELMIGLSNNRWDGIPSEIYRPSYQTVSLDDLGIGRVHEPAIRAPWNCRPVRNLPSAC